jgi:RNA polymerase sigma factor (TIGR02999 family)
MTATTDLTQILASWNNGDKTALEKLMPLVYNELRHMAARYLKSEHPSHTIQPTALVHEAYLRLMNQRHVQWQNRAHFFAIAAQMMRRILINYARDQHAAKRGGNSYKLLLDEAISVPADRNLDLLALDDALKLLSKIDARKSQLVELRFFSGLSIEEAANIMGISIATAKRDWMLARAWLYREISNEAVKNVDH